MPNMKHRSLYHLFSDVVEANRENVAYRYKSAGAWHDVTWGEQAATVRAIGRSLMALGVKKGDRVAILSQTRLEWVQCDFGIGACGGVTVGIYPSNLPRECAYIINHSEARFLFVENREQLEKVLSVQRELHKLERIIRYEGAGEPDKGVLGWEGFLEGGEKVPESDLEERYQEIQPEDLASLVYTSGTTGVPKGAMITHRNLLFTSHSASQSLHHEPYFTSLLFLPLAHVFARLIVHMGMRNANTIAFAESMQKIGENLKETRPHYIASAPRIFEKVHEKITAAQRTPAVSRRRSSTGPSAWGRM